MVATHASSSLVINLRLIFWKPKKKKNSMQVWGFETLTSERRQLQQQQQQHGRHKDNNNNKDNSNSGVLYRKRGRVFPEVGCALDNLSL